MPSFTSRADASFEEGWGSNNTYEHTVITYPSPPSIPHARHWKYNFELTCNKAPNTLDLNNSK